VWGTYTSQRAKLKKSLHSPTGITGWVFQHQNVARVANVHKHQPWTARYLEISPETVSELDVPLMDGKKAIGVLNLESSKENAFSKDDQAFLETLAAQAVLAITRAQEYEHKQRLAEEQRVLNEISKEIVSQLDLKRVFDQILIRMLALTKSQNGILMLYNTEKDLLWMAAERGVLPEKRGLPNRLDEGVVGYAARTKRALNVDPSQAPWHEYYLDYIPDTRSELAVPILAGEQLLGVLNVESVEEHAFGESDKRLLQGLADLTAVALRNAEFYHKAEQAALSFQLLYQAGQELGEISEPKQLEQGYEVIACLAEKQSQSSVAVRRYEEATGDLVLKKIASHDPQHDIELR
ncbi:MAG: GAF domain-containing protein, partial [Ktedonobacteraceae bacterium]